MLRTLTILFLFIFIQMNEAREVPDLDKVAAMKNQLNDETEYERRNQHHYSESGLWRTVSGMLRMLGYDRNEIGRMSINMILYTGEMLANTILDIETNNIDTELEQYRAFSDSGNWFTYAKGALERSHSRGGQIMSSLLDPELMNHMIEKLANKTGSSTSCVQQFLCKMSPYIRSAQLATDTTLNHIMDQSLQQSSDSWLRTMYGGVPAEQDFQKLSQQCEQQFPACSLIHFDHSLAANAEE